MSRHFPLSFIGSGLLFVSLAANANYLLVTASGSVTGGRDSTNYLGYGTGSTVKGELAGLSGQSISISWLLDLDLAGPDILGGGQAGRAVYTGGSCPGANSWLTTVGVTLGGSTLDVAPAPASNVEQCGTAEVWDQALNGRFDSIAVANETRGQSSGILDDGSTLTKSTFVGASFSIVEFGLDFIQGIDLDQSFLWTQGAGADLSSVGAFARQTSLTNCFDAACASADLINFQINSSFTEVTAQVIRSVPEPSALLLLGVGLLLAALGNRSMKSTRAMRRQ